MPVLEGIHRAFQMEEKNVDFFFAVFPYILITRRGFGASHGVFEEYPQCVCSVHAVVLATCLEDMRNLFVGHSQQFEGYPRLVSQVFTMCFRDSLVRGSCQRASRISVRCCANPLDVFHGCPQPAICKGSDF